MSEERRSSGFVLYRVSMLDTMTSLGRLPGATLNPRRPASGLGLRLSPPPGKVLDGYRAKAQVQGPGTRSTLLTVSDNPLSQGSESRLTLPPKGISKPTGYSHSAPLQDKSHS